MAATPAISFSLLLVVLAVSTKGSSAAGSSWCVCKPELPPAALQRTLDYACGHGADCSPLLPGGQCHTDTDTVAARCSYAANSYYHNAKAKANGGGGATCDFGGTATLTSTDPSSGACQYPASASAGGGMEASSSGTPAGLSGTTTTPLLLVVLLGCVWLSCRFWKSCCGKAAVEKLL